MTVRRSVPDLRIFHFPFIPIAFNLCRQIRRKKSSNGSGGTTSNKPEFLLLWEIFNFRMLFTALLKKWSEFLWEKIMILGLSRWQILNEIWREVRLTVTSSKRHGNPGIFYRDFGEAFTSGTICQRVWISEIFPAGTRQSIAVLWRKNHAKRSRKVHLGRPGLTRKRCRKLMRGWTLPQTVGEKLPKPERKFYLSKLRFIIR